MDGISTDGGTEVSGDDHLVERSVDGILRPAIRIGLEELTDVFALFPGTENIEIARHVAKKHSRRLVPICATLKAWPGASRLTKKDALAILSIGPKGKKVRTISAA